MLSSIITWTVLHCRIIPLFKPELSGVLHGQLTYSSPTVVEIIKQNIQANQTVWEDPNGVEITISWKF